MPAEALLALGTVIAVFGFVASARFPPEFCTSAGLVALLVAGVLTPAEAFSGFGNPAVIAIAGLFIVARALRETGALDRASLHLLDRARETSSARLRLCGLTVAMSAFINNTPLVALMAPIASRWADRTGKSVRSLLLPISYAAILGGICTLMGTSTHLVVHGLLLERGEPGFGVFELTPIGLPAAIVGMLVLGLIAKRFLDRDDPGARAPIDQRRQYTADLFVSEASPLVGNDIESAGLRHLPGLFLVRIERADRIIAPVAPDERLRAGDRLTFAGVLETIVDLQKRRGLLPVESAGESGTTSPDSRLHEAVVSRGSALVGRSVRDANFRGRYNAAVFAVHRKGEPIHAKIGDIVLRPGDTLLLEATAGFLRTFRDAPEFYLINEIADSARPRHKLAPVASLIFVMVVAVTATGVLPLATAALAGGILCVFTGCIAPGTARRAVDPSVVLVIATTLGLARAVEQTGAAAAIAGVLIGLREELGPVGLLAVVYLTGTVLTELVTNTAAAAILFPIALSVAEQAALPHRPFALAITIAASVSLCTPLGYQTNMMVYGPGGYRLRDFVKMGVPIQIAVGATALFMLSFSL